MSVLYGNDPVKNEINIKNLGEIRGFIYVSTMITQEVRATFFLWFCTNKFVKNVKIITKFTDVIDDEKKF